MRELSVEYNPDAIAYGMKLMEDLAHVQAGQKPLVIAEQSKCPTAYEALVDIVREEPGLYIKTSSLVGEDGEFTSVAFVCANGAPYADDAIRAIYEHIGAVQYQGVDKAKSRRGLQITLGLLLGYGAGEVMDFVNSETGRTCVCDCCGGPNTVQAAAKDDPNPGRFTPNAYRY